ncbi:hypothetical protein BDZ94DRAFT_985631 [Collybia nuda]|uniref:Secreted protein n=1 Tax=Collybia nuda TaxID=64659 RepID=A0A9P6CBS6_9AGAR|nr:hypothetical protein BDZ94DRAFT_985631 [Collybia nuda]
MANHVSTVFFPSTTVLLAWVVSTGWDHLQAHINCLISPVGYQSDGHYTKSDAYHVVIFHPTWLLGEGEFYGP